MKSPIASMIECQPLMRLVKPIRMNLLQILNLGDQLPLYSSADCEDLIAKIVKGLRALVVGKLGNDEDSLAMPSLKKLAKGSKKPANKREKEKRSRSSEGFTPEHINAVISRRADLNMRCGAYFLEALVQEHHLQADERDEIWEFIVGLRMLADCDRYERIRQVARDKLSGARRSLFSSSGSLTRASIQLQPTGHYEYVDCHYHGVPIPAGWEGTVKANSVVVLRDPEGMPIFGTGEGNGPVHAMARAVKNATKREFKTHRLQSSQYEHADSIATSAVQITTKTGTYEGQGADSDSIRAECMAIIDALNAELDALNAEL